MSPSYLPVLALEFVFADKIKWLFASQFRLAAIKQEDGQVRRLI